MAAVIQDSVFLASQMLSDRLQNTRGFWHMHAHTRTHIRRHIPAHPQSVTHTGMTGHEGATHLSIGWVCLEGMRHGGNGLSVIIILSMHCAQQPPCIHIVRLPLHLFAQAGMSLAAKKASVPVLQGMGFD